MNNNTNHYKNTKVIFTSTINAVPRNSGEVVSVNPMTAAMIRQMRHRFTGQVPRQQSHSSSFLDKSPSSLRNLSAVVWPRHYAQYSCSYYSAAHVYNPKP